MYKRPRMQSNREIYRLLTSVLLVLQVTSSGINYSISKFGKKKLKILKKCFLTLETDWRFFVKYKEKWAYII